MLSERNFIILQLCGGLIFKPLSPFVYFGSTPSGGCSNDKIFTNSEFSLLKVSDDPIIISSAVKIN